MWLQIKNYQLVGSGWVRNFDSMPDENQSIHKQMKFKTKSNVDQSELKLAFRIKPEHTRKKSK